jgi:hypothetical protein
MLRQPFCSLGKGRLRTLVHGCADNGTRAPSEAYETIEDPLSKLDQGILDYGCTVHFDLILNVQDSSYESAAQSKPFS